MSSNSDLDTATRHRLDALSDNAKAKMAESTAPVRDKDWFKRHVVVPTAPIFIASTEDLGTNRVRANHIDAAIDYCTEQEKLRNANAPL